MEKTSRITWKTNNMDDSLIAVVEGNPDAPNIPNSFPDYISADYRLDKFNSITPETGIHVSEI